MHHGEFRGVLTPAGLLIDHVELIADYNGLNADQAAVVAALSEPWSTGQTEGQITNSQPP